MERPEKSNTGKSHYAMPLKQEAGPAAAPPPDGFVLRQAQDKSGDKPACRQAGSGLRKGRQIFFRAYVSNTVIEAFFDKHILNSKDPSCAYNKG